MNELDNFLKKRLPKYSTDRNNPVKDGLSNLSPWLHFGLYKNTCKIFIYDTIIIYYRSDISTKMYLRS